MPFSTIIRESALVRSARHCCVCHEFAGRAITVHHIIQEADGGENSIDNAIVLCLRCHSEAGHFNSRHPIGTKYAPSELKKHRDNWWAIVANGTFKPAGPSLDVTWKRTFLSSDLHKYRVLVRLRNGTTTAINQWKLQLLLPAQIPVRCVGFTEGMEERDKGIRYSLFQLAGGPVMIGEEVNLLDAQAASVEYDMTQDVFWKASKNAWLIIWRFLSSAHSPVDGSRPWTEMHEF